MSWDDKNWHKYRVGIRFSDNDYMMQMTLFLETVVNGLTRHANSPDDLDRQDDIELYREEIKTAYKESIIGHHILAWLGRDHSLDRSRDWLLGERERGPRPKFFIGHEIDDHIISLTTTDPNTGQDHAWDNAEFHYIDYDGEVRSI